MPTKRNSAGQQQPYVPEGHGDASGEYSEHATGSNKNYVSPTDTSRQLPSPSVDVVTPKTKTETPPRTPNEVKKQLNGGKDVEIPEQMKTADYTYGFVQPEEIKTFYGTRTIEAEVKITRGSLSKDEIGEFNKQIKEMFDNYPEMKKFNKIFVRNAKASSQGGFIKTSRNFVNGNEFYELYINSGWLDSTPGERVDEENIKYYNDKIKFFEDNKSRLPEAQEMIDKFKSRIESIKEKMSKGDKEFYNVISKSKGRRERLKSLLAHELMHRIYGYKVNPELEEKIREVYRTALSNGDAKKISTYATTSKQEFISEAYSQIEMGIETPQYIVDIVNQIKGENK